MKRNEKILLTGGSLGVLLLLYFATRKKDSDGNGVGPLNLAPIPLDWPVNPPVNPGLPPDLNPGVKPKVGKGLQIGDLNINELPPPPELPKEEPKSEPSPNAKGPEILKVPIPGNYYEIQKGDNLLTVAGKAYGYLGGSSDRMNAARQINISKYNKRFWHYSPDSLFPPTKVRISFNPKYAFNFMTQYEDEANGGLNQGKSYAVIWIPTKDEWVINEAAKTRL